MNWFERIWKRPPEPQHWPPPGPDPRFCWCDSGTLNFTNRNHSGAPYPHIHSDYLRREPHFWRELTDEEWADAMRDTPFRDDLNAERAAKRA